MASKYSDRNFTLVQIYLVVFLLLSSEYCRAVENITKLQKLPEDKTLVSPGRVFELGFFSPNNSASNRYVGIWYKNISPLTVVWVLNREKPISFEDSPASLTISESGNLELVDRNNNPVWSTKHGVLSNTSVATLTDNGNFVLTDVEASKILWQSIDRLGDTFLPGSGIGYDEKTRENDVLTSWKSDSDPSPGDFTLGISTKLFPAQAYILKGTRLHWRSGPWDGKEFTGIPVTDVRNNVGEQNPFDLIEAAEQRIARIVFNPYNVSAVSPKYYLSPQGVFKSTLKVHGSDRRTIWQSQQTPCDSYGICGNFGVCKASRSPKLCTCLKGYAPKSGLEWREQNWNRGCFRETELRCERNDSRGKNDEFVKLERIKLPDFYQYLAFPTNIGDCQKTCVGNCSCSAYAYIEGIGCLVWFESVIDVQEFSTGGKSLFLRLAHEKGKNANKTIIISLATISIAVCLCVFLVVCLRRRSVKRKKNVEVISEKSEVRKSSNFRPDIQSTEQKYQSDSPIFTYESLSGATDNFSLSNKLGQGGFGPVYKGKLQDGTEIAVKRLSSSSGQGTREFQNEMVLVSKLQHRNLVRLLGFCTENDEKLLVYEYLPNKSLDNFVFDSQRSEQLDWRTRFNIIIGIARGLIYLHRDSFLRVIHRDLKASNVLLDNKMNPKIADFGLAKIYEETSDVDNTQRIVGSRGYMSPEYAMGGIFSEKSDVYSFGILMLEIISGRKNTSFNFYDNHYSLVGCAWELWREGREVEMVDKALENAFCSEEAVRCVNVGLLCVQDQAVDRPTMPSIVSMLMNETDRSQPKEPLFTFERQKPQSRQQNDSKGSVNEATITASMLEGR